MCRLEERAVQGVQGSELAGGEKHTHILLPRTACRFPGTLKNMPPSIAEVVLACTDLTSVPVTTQVKAPSVSLVGVPDKFCSLCFVGGPVSKSSWFSISAPKAPQS